MAEQMREEQLASFWNVRFKDAMVHKAPYTKRWQTYLDAYNGDYFKNENLPDYKSDLVSNYIFSIIETIRPIMLDNDPQFQALARQPEGMQFSNDLQEALSYEWDRERMSTKLKRSLITQLVFGTAVYFLPWDSEDKNVRAIPVNPFNLFPDPLATTVEDAEYLIYASYKNVVRLQRMFPEHAEKLTGSRIQFSELVSENDKDARITDQVLVLEIYTRDYDFELERLEAGGSTKFEKKKMKYPNGRVLTICPELNLVLDDKPNAYKDKKFPFSTFKAYDVPDKFWGEGEVAQLISPQKYMNELNNAILDNAKTTANMPWIIDKNSGIGYGKITARPGLVIRKNPGSEVKRDQPPSMPAYVVNAVDTYKQDMEQISGVFDTLKGNSETGVYTAQGILALQEAGQARIRLKVKLLEESLGHMACMWFNRMKQFWKDERWFAVTRADGTYDLRQFTKEALNYEYDIRITAGSTMPVNRGAMLDLMVRLAQTPMPDGQMLVDREAVATYLPEEVKSAMLRRMGGQNQQLEELQQQMEQLTQGMQQYTQENDARDGQTMDVVENITKTIESLNKKILQLTQSHAKLEEDKRKQEEISRIRSESYNKGYGDAEKLLDSDDELLNPESNDFKENNPLPDDILEGIEDLSDDELALLVQQNPELLDLLGE